MLCSNERERCRCAASSLLLVSTLFACPVLMSLPTVVLLAFANSFDCRHDVVVYVCVLVFTLVLVSTKDLESDSAPEGSHHVRKWGETEASTSFGFSHEGSERRPRYRKTQKLPDQRCVRRESENYFFSMGTFSSLEGGVHFCRLCVIYICTRGSCT